MEAQRWQRSPELHSSSSRAGIWIFAFLPTQPGSCFLHQEFNFSSLLSECQLLLVNARSVCLLLRSAILFTGAYLCCVWRTDQIKDMGALVNNRASSSTWPLCSSDGPRQAFIITSSYFTTECWIYIIVSRIVQRSRAIILAYAIMLVAVIHKV